MNEDGSHKDPKPSFPPTSKRASEHKKYDALKTPTKDARNDYNTRQKSAKDEIKLFSDRHKLDVDNRTGGYTPSHHQDLFPLAEKATLRSHESAILREGFLTKYPIGYHTKADQHQHHDWAEEKYDDANRSHKLVRKHEHFRHKSPYRSPPPSPEIRFNPKDEVIFPDMKNLSMYPQKRSGTYPLTNPTSLPLRTDTYPTTSTSKSGKSKGKQPELQLFTIKTSSSQSEKKKNRRK